MTAIVHDLLDLPEAVRRGDFVQGLTDGIAKPEETLPACVPTPRPIDVDAAVVSWSLDVDEDVEAPPKVDPDEGPLMAGARDVGAVSLRVSDAPKVLLGDGRVEMFDGRPARYVATGDDA